MSRLAWTSKSSSLSLLSGGIRGVHYHILLTEVILRKKMEIKFQERKMLNLCKLIFLLQKWGEQTAVSGDSQQDPRSNHKEKETACVKAHMGG